MEQEKDKFLSIIQKSGHDFHLKVSNFFKEAGWDVTNSPHYNDPDSDKSREIDIEAKKEYPVIYHSFGRRGEKIVVKFYIECKYIKSPIVFWFKEKNKEKAIELAKDNPIMEDKPDHYFNAKEKHHYVEGNEVAVEWTQENNDVIADAKHKVLKALIVSQNEGSEYYEIKYPIIIINDLEQLAKREVGEKNYSKINNNFQIEVNYSYKDNKKNDIKKYFLIDLVSYTLLDNFIKELESNDISMLKNNLAFDLRQRDHRERENQWDDDSVVNIAR